MPTSVYDQLHCNQIFFEWHSTTYNTYLQDLLLQVR